jgi:hypothetical protein
VAQKCGFFTLIGFAGEIERATQKSKLYQKDDPSRNINEGTLKLDTSKHLGSKEYNMAYMSSTFLST